MYNAEYTNLQTIMSHTPTVMLIVTVYHTLKIKNKSECVPRKLSDL